MTLMLAVAQPLRNEGAGTAWRGGRDPMSHSELICASWTRWEEPVKNLITRMRNLTRDDAGQDLLEYALLVALIALVAVAAVKSSGQAVNSIFTSVASQLQNAAQAGGA
jgi:pilus assembly protein Flp/PilA